VVTLYSHLTSGVTSGGGGKPTYKVVYSLYTCKYVEEKVKNTCGLARLASPHLTSLGRAILMNCDNQTVIVKLGSSKDNMKSSRHIKRRLKSVRKMKNSDVIILDYIHIEKNLTDPFTNGLSRNVIDDASKEIGLKPT
jgi:hypothetical protein